MIMTIVVIEMMVMMTYEQEVEAIYQVYIYTYTNHYYHCYHE